MSYEFGWTEELVRMRLGFALARPSSHVKITGIVDGPASPYAPRLVLVGPGLWRPPLWTRHMLGVREAERDRRTNQKGGRHEATSRRTRDGGRDDGRVGGGSSSRARDT